MDAHLKALTSSPVTSLSESLSTMDVDQKNKASEPMLISEEDEIVVTKTPPKRSPRASKKKAIIISSESDLDSEVDMTPSESEAEESDFEDDE
jgi:hypothetical protein